MLACGARAIGPRAYENANPSCGLDHSAPGAMGFRARACLTIPVVARRAARGVRCVRSACRAQTLVPGVLGCVPGPVRVRAWRRGADGNRQAGPRAVRTRRRRRQPASRCEQWRRPLGPAAVRLTPVRLENGVPVRRVLFRQGRRRLSGQHGDECAGGPTVRAIGQMRDLIQPPVPRLFFVLRALCGIHSSLEVRWFNSPTRPDSTTLTARAVRELTSILRIADFT